jgi:hypothetical protein
LSFVLSFFLVWCSLILPSSSYLSFSSSKAYSRNHSSFFGSGKVEKKLVSEVNLLKGELASKQAELEVERQGCQVTEGALRAQIGESERRKNDALATLYEASEKSEGFKKDLKVSKFFFVFHPFSLFLCLSDFLTCISCAISSSKE